MAELLVEVCKIDDIFEHPNADRLEFAKVKGWNCIVEKDKWEKGDTVVFIPPDSVMPDDLIDKYELEYLRNGGKRVRTVKLRGCVSQGLILPPPEGDWEIGDNVAEEMGITKWVPDREIYQQPKSNKPTKRKKNPDFHKYTNINNIKHFNKVFKKGDTVVIQEKLHGTNFRAANLPIYTEHDNFLKNIWSKIKFVFNGGYEFVYGSRNVQITYQNKRSGYYGKDIYGKIASRYDLKNKIPEDYIVYGEIYGNGVQDLTYGLNDIELALFDVKYKDKYLPYEEFKNFCKDKDLPIVPVLYTGLWKDDLLEKYTVGDSTLCSNQIREGIVIKDYFESNHPRCGRKILKSISEDYLLRKNGTEYH